MTVSTSAVLPSGPYVPDGANRSWDFNFKVTDSSQLVIVLEDGAGVQTEITSGFTVPSSDIGTDEGGTITYPVAPTAPLEFTDYEKVYITRAVPYGQQTVLGNTGPYYPATVEEALDLLSMQIQQLKEGLDRADLSPLGSGETGSDPTLVHSGDVDTIVKLTQAAYDALSSTDANTLYLIVG